MTEKPPRRAGSDRWSRDAIRDSANTAISTATLITTGVVVLVVIAIAVLGFYALSKGI